MSPEKFSERNIVNSVATYLAAKLLAAGYLLYWHKSDVLQIEDTPTGWYREFSQNKATILATPAVVTAMANAKGVLTLVDGLPAVPRFITRLISDESLGLDDAITVPAISVEVSPVVLTMPYEMGSKAKWRLRHLLIDSFQRTPEEQAAFKDWLGLWFEQDTIFKVFDHEGAMAEVGELSLDQVRVDSDRFPQGPEATTYQVLAQAVAEYVA